LSNLRVWSLLIIGLDTAPVAASARRAGYEVYAVDYFGDQDVRRLCADSLSIVEEKPGKSCGKVGRDFSPEKLVSLARLLAKRHRIDGILLSSGVEDSPSALSDLAEIAPVLASPLGRIAAVRDKASFFSELERLGIPHPQTTMARGVREAEIFAWRVGYPVVVKPETGFGGAGILLARDREELAGAFAGNTRRLLVQEYVVGTPASVSLISSGERAVALTVNEQLIGVRELGLKGQFGWCGNIVPLSGPGSVLERAKAVASKIVERFGLVGSVGVDMVISQDGVPRVVEVNPRFQGTLECVEAVTGLNLVKLHAEACLRGEVPEPVPVTGVSARLIVYAPKRVSIPDISGVRGVRNLPFVGVIVEEGEPVCSVFSIGEKRGSCLSTAMERANEVLGLLSSA
jgi:predicted ATP-grasp superfamily ATP-dependent carboligase